jgi:hypothetical protein
MPVMKIGQVAGFKPSTHGFHFANAFPHVPVLRIRFPGIGSLPIGDASNGLCGGMVFTVRDLFHANRPPPPETMPPAEESDLYRYLVQRLFHSFRLPIGPLRYYQWMQLPDRDRGPLGGVMTRTIQEWPRVQREIDEGSPAPLGLVRLRSANPFLMGKNHQVLAYGYQLEAATGQLSLQLYDPNYPDHDELILSLNLHNPEKLAPIRYSTGEAVRGFFHTTYRNPLYSSDFLAF